MIFFILVPVVAVATIIVVALAMNGKLHAPSFRATTSPSGTPATAGSKPKKFKWKKPLKFAGWVVLIIAIILVVWRIRNEQLAIQEREAAAIHKALPPEDTTFHTLILKKGDSATVSIPVDHKLKYQFWPTAAKYYSYQNGFERVGVFKPKLDTATVVYRLLPCSYQQDPCHW